MACHVYDLTDDELWVGNIISKQELLLWKILPILGQEVQSKGPLTDIQYKKAMYTGICSSGLSFNSTYTSHLNFSNKIK